MSLKFQADADLNPQIGERLRRIEPAIDFRPAKGIYPDGTPDPEVLRIAAEAGRVLVSRDVNTMFASWYPFVELRESPGLILIPHARSIADTVESLLLVWSMWDGDAIRNQARWLPHPEELKALRKRLRGY